MVVRGTHCDSGRNDCLVDKCVEDGRSACYARCHTENGAGNRVVVETSGRTCTRVSERYRIGSETIVQRSTCARAER